MGQNFCHNSDMCAVKDGKKKIYVKVMIYQVVENCIIIEKLLLKLNNLKFLLLKKGGRVDGHNC